MFFASRIDELIEASYVWWSTYFWFSTGVKERPSEDLTGLEQQTTSHGGNLTMRGKGENCLKPGINKWVGSAVQAPQSRMPMTVEEEERQKVITVCASAVPQSWTVAGKLWVPKEEGSSANTQFRSISYLSVENKVFFTVVARRLTTYMMQNQNINTSIQKFLSQAFQVVWNTHQWSPSWSKRPSWRKAS